MKVWFAGKICLEKSKIRDLEGQHHVSNVEHLKEKKECMNFWRMGVFSFWNPYMCGNLGSADNSFELPCPWPTSVGHQTPLGYSCRLVPAIFFFFEIWWDMAGVYFGFWILLYYYPLLLVNWYMFNIVWKINA